ncbi:hypothetical protein V6N13_113109 [Hibiscus sabdariffa]|uniref:indole-3-pyruvate monooxygenase n=1 Tax=Hibiscus sabdariffa TaxID=183260 RepID=A0ABR2CW73_9ROSI
MTKLASCLWVTCPIIIGAGPSGLATAASLKKKGIPSLILERADCIASLWKLKTYDRLHLHLPKQFCELPFMSFPANFPTYPTKNQFLDYLESYKNHFGLEPVFNKTVVSAEFDHRYGVWRVVTLGPEQEHIEYVSQWLVMATGENAVEVMPLLKECAILVGLYFTQASTEVEGRIKEKMFWWLAVGIRAWRLLLDKRVALDLANFNARTSLVVRDSEYQHMDAQVVPHSPCGLVFAYDVAFPTRRHRKICIPPSQNWSLELKSITGKTPVLDVGC